MCVYLISDSGKQSIEACCKEHAPSKWIAQRQWPPVSLCFIIVNEQETYWDQHTSQHKAEQAQQAKQLGHQDLHPDASETLERTERWTQSHHTRLLSAASDGLYWSCWDISAGFSGGDTGRCWSQCTQEINTSCTGLCWKNASKDSDRQISPIYISHLSYTLIGVFIFLSLVQWVSFGLI